MKLEQIVTSQKLSKQLKEAGVPQKSVFWWNPYYTIVGEKDDVLRYELETSQKSYAKWGTEDIESISAFTASELGELLPNLFQTYRYDDEYECIPQYEGISEDDMEDSTLFVDKSMVEAMGKMVLYLIQQKIINFEGEK